MQLDRTRVVIRERSLLELFDLSLQLARVGGQRLLVTFLAGVIPLALLNAWLLSPVLEMEEFSSDANGRYLWLMVQLVFLEAQLATAPATLLLGDLMFLEPPSGWRIVRSLRKLFGRLFVCQGLLRGILPAWLLCLTLDPVEVTAADVLLPILCIVVIFLRAVRPFLNEIILLEQNPLRSRNKQAISIGNRSATLQNPNSGELFGSWILSATLAVPLTGALALTIWFIQVLFVHEWDWGLVMRLGGVPAAMWMVACFFAVMRFLHYIDLRIRREGWAVELQLRAEASRLSNQLS